MTMLITQDSAATSTYGWWNWPERMWKWPYIEVHPPPVVWNTFVWAKPLEKVKADYLVTRRFYIRNAEEHLPPQNRGVSRLVSMGRIFQPRR